MFFMFKFMDASSEANKVLFTREVEEVSVEAAVKEYDRACSLLGLKYTVEGDLRQKVLDELTELTEEMGLYER